MKIVNHFEEIKNKCGSHRYHERRNMMEIRGDIETKIKKIETLLLGRSRQKAHVFSDDPEHHLVGPAADREQPRISIFT